MLHFISTCRFWALLKRNLTLFQHRHTSKDILFADYEAAENLSNITHTRRTNWKQTTYTVAAKHRATLHCETSRYITLRPSLQWTEICNIRDFQYTINVNITGAPIACKVIVPSMDTPRNNDFLRMKKPQLFLWFVWWSHIGLLNIYIQTQNSDPMMSSMKTLLHLYHREEIWTKKEFSIKSIKFHYEQRVIRDS